MKDVTYRLIGRKKNANGTEDWAMTPLHGGSFFLLKNCQVDEYDLDAEPATRKRRRRKCLGSVDDQIIDANDFEPTSEVKIGLTED